MINSKNRVVLITVAAQELVLRWQGKCWMKARKS